LDLFQLSFFSGARRIFAGIINKIRLFKKVRRSLFMPTLSDVAKRANVSKMTVSRVINRPEQVTDELKSLVYKAMEDLNYKPNRLARALAEQRTQIIKLYILEEMENVEPYYMNLLTGIANELDNYSYGLQLLTRESTHIGESDGYIICGMRESDYENIDQIGQPVVLFGENVHNYDFVDSNNTLSIEKAYEHGVRTGYTSIVFIQLKIDEPFARSREKGYLNAANKHQFPTQVIRLENSSTEASIFIKEHLEEYPANTLFICATDRLALGISRTIIELGGQVPDAYGVTGHDGVFLDQIASPRLTTLKQPIKEMGAACARMVIQKIKDQGKTQESQLYETELIRGGTTRKSETE